MTALPDLQRSPLMRRWCAVHAPKPSDLPASTADSSSGLSQTTPGSPTTSNADFREPSVAVVTVGTAVHDVSPSPTADHLYVLAENSVKVVNRRHHIVSALSVGAHPKGALPSDDGSHVYLTSYDGAITIITTADHTVKSVVAEQSTAEVVSPDGRRIYLVHNRRPGDGRPAWISVVSCDGTVVAALPVESYASDMALAPDGSHLYVTTSDRSSYHQHSCGSISIIDTSCYEVIGVIDLPFSADTVAVTADGGSLYVTHFDADAISVIDLTTHRVDCVAVGDAPIAVTVGPDSTYAYITTPRSTKFLDNVTRTVETLEITDSPHQVHITGDGKHAYLVDFTQRRLWMLDTVDNSVVGAVDVVSASGTMALSVDDQLLYVTDYWGGTVEVLFDGSDQPTSLTPLMH